MPKLYLDSNILIYAIEGETQFRLSAEAIIAQALKAGIQLCTSEFSVGECLIGAFKRANPRGAELYIRTFFERPESMTLLPVTRSVIEDAARLGGSLGLKLADAIHVASAAQAGCASFATNDSHIAVPRGMTIISLRGATA